MSGIPASSDVYLRLWNHDRATLWTHVALGGRTGLVISLVCLLAIFSKHYLRQISTMSEFSCSFVYRNSNGEYIMVNYSHVTFSCHLQLSNLSVVKNY